MSEKNKKKDQKNKNGSLVNLVEGTRRLVMGNPSDEENITSWKDTLLLIVLLIVVFFLYSLFG